MTAGRRVPGAGPRSQDQTNAGGRSRPDDMETHLALPRVADIECGSDIDKIIDKLLNVRGKRPGNAYTLSPHRNPAECSAID